MTEPLEALKKMGTDLSFYVVKTAQGNRRKILTVVKIQNDSNKGYLAQVKGDPHNTVLANADTLEDLLARATKYIEETWPEFGPFSIEPYTDPRPSWDHYFIDIAQQVAKRATCPRKAVGAVIVMDRRILATGYNGAIPGAPHCIEVGCDLIKLADGSENCHRIVHAEQNALLQAAQYGVPVAGSSIYLNTYPCWNCFKSLATAKIREVFYFDSYRNDLRVRDAALDAGVTITQVR